MAAQDSVLTQIARPYASALFDLAKADNSVAAVEQGGLSAVVKTEHFGAMIAANPTNRKILEDLFWALLNTEEFTFSREWLRTQAASVTDLRPGNVVRQLNLPPSYVLIHRVHMAGIGVLCQLGTTARFRDEVIRWVPGFSDDPDDTGAKELATA